MNFMYMRTRFILFIALAGLLAACTNVDPQSITDPVGRGALETVTISVTSEQVEGTKATVKFVGEENQTAVLTFDEGDRLHLFEIREYSDGSISTLYYFSKNTKVGSNRKNAEFTFDIVPNNDTTVRNISYFAAFGDWSLSGDKPVFNIPSNFRTDENGESELPMDGFIAKSRIYGGEEAENIFSTSVELEQLTSFGNINISGLDGKDIRRIQVERADGKPLAGKATVGIDVAEFFIQSDIINDTLNVYTIADNKSDYTLIFPGDFTSEGSDYSFPIFPANIFQSLDITGSDATIIFYYGLTDGLDITDGLFLDITSNVPHDLMGSLKGDCSYIFVKDCTAYSNDFNGVSIFDAFSPVSINNNSSTVISIWPSNNVGMAIAGGDGTSVRFPSLPETFSYGNKLRITLTDNEGHRYLGEYTAQGTLPGNTAGINISGWTAIE